MHILNLYLGITRLCTLECEHCLRGDRRNENMSLETIANVFKDVKEIDTLLLTGGEPLLAIKQIKEVLKQIRENNIKVHKTFIITNCTFLNEEIIKLLKEFSDISKLELALSYDVFHYVELKRLKLLKDYIENTSKYAESVYYDGYYEIHNKLFREGNAINLDKNLTVPLKPMKTFATYVGKNNIFDMNNGLCNIGPIVTINVDGTITESDASFKNQNTIYNYGNVLNESIIECLLRNKMKTVKPNKFERKVNKQIMKYFTYKH